MEEEHFRKWHLQKPHMVLGNGTGIAHLQLHSDTDDLHLDHDPGTLNLTLNFNIRTLILTPDVHDPTHNLTFTLSLTLT